jgi:hypothetical protein
MDLSPGGINKEIKKGESVPILNGTPQPSDLHGVNNIKSQYDYSK